jgi:hypothetical protein
MSAVSLEFMTRIGWDRILAASSSTILLIAVVSALFTAPLVGFAYLRHTTRIGAEFSLLTKDFAMAFLGNYADVFSTFPRRALWAWCLWLLLLLWPAAQVIWALRTEDFEKSAGRWCLGMVAYLSVACALVTLVIIALMMPFLNL